MNNKKRILLIMPNFFNYPTIISRSLKNKGYEVDVFDDRPSTNPWVKAAVRFNKNLIKKYIKNYFKKVLQLTNDNQYKYVLLISGQSLSFDESMIKILRKKHKEATFILYQWDSMSNFPYIARMHKYFDRLYTFDREDAKNYEQLTFLPLFYSDQYKKIAESNSPIKYDTFFVGTAHPKKYYFIKKMTAQLSKVYKNQYIYYFFPSRLVYWYRKCFNIELRHAKMKEFHFQPLNDNKINKLMSESKIVLDSPQSGQTGLTIRVIETLGSKKKLITTNSDIKNYDFYNPQNIYVYDGRFDFNSTFFKEPYKELDKDIYHKYSLDNWLHVLLRD